MFSLETISAKMLDYYVERSDSLIIDLRSETEYQKSHVKNAIWMPYEQAETGADFPKDKTLIFYCQRGGASMVIAKHYVKLGYRCRSVIGGFGAYRGRNLVFSR